MAKEKRKFSKELIGKTVVSKTGKTFGKVSDLYFDIRTGELIDIIIKNPTQYATDLELEKDKVGNIRIPFNSVIAVSDFIVLAEEDIM